MSESVLPPSLNPIASARWLHLPRTAAPWLSEEVGARMADRLSWIRRAPTTWLDWYPLQGGLKAHQKVQAHYPNATRHWIETTQQRQKTVQKALQGVWWQRFLHKSMARMGLPQEGTVDMVWANMALHLSPEPEALLRQWQRLLAVDGFLMFSCLGPDTLRELQHLYHEQGWGPACQEFTDMHDWGDMLVHAGFAEPVMDMERLTLTYDTPAQLLAELRLLGRNLHQQRAAQPRGRAWRGELAHKLSGLASASHGGRLALTVEIIYGHALKAAPRIKLEKENQIALQDMRSLLGVSRGKPLVQ